MPAIDQFWEEHQRAILDRLKDEQLVLLGEYDDLREKYKQRIKVLRAYVVKIMK